jgi:hypothetical protein
MIGLILLENINIFQMFCLYAKYVPRFYGITSSLKRKIGISQLYIHGVQDSTCRKKVIKYAAYCFKNLGAKYNSFKTIRMGSSDARYRRLIIPKCQQVEHSHSRHATRWIGTTTLKCL